MGIIYILVPASIGLALLALAAYFWSVHSGQFEDLDTPALRALLDDEPLSLESEELTDTPSEETEPVNRD